MTPLSVTGGCLCGSVRYESAAPVSEATFCHCRSCRRATGAHAVPWATVALRSLRWIGAVPPGRFVSSPGVTRSFCPRCGTPLAYFSEASPATVDLTLGSVDDPESLAPVDHTWMADAVSWDDPQDGRPRHARTRRG